MSVGRSCQQLGTYTLGDSGKVYSEWVKYGTWYRTILYDFDNNYDSRKTELDND